MSTAIKKRLTALEDQAGIRGIDRAELALLDDDERDFYLMVRRRERANPERYLLELTDAELERWIDVHIRVTDASDWSKAPAGLRDEWEEVKAGLVVRVERRQERRA